VLFGSQYVPKRGGAVKAAPASSRGLAEVRGRESRTVYCDHERGSASPRIDVRICVTLLRHLNCRQPLDQVLAQEHLHDLSVPGVLPP